jgi:hypothetical protein
MQPAAWGRGGTRNHEEAAIVMDPPVYDAYTPVAWALFTKLEEVEEAGRDLPDPEVDGFVEAAEAEIGVGGLLSGWAIVAALLRKSLIEHAETLGCNCGSLEWLRSEQLRLASREE